MICVCFGVRILVTHLDLRGARRHRRRAPRSAIVNRPLIVSHQDGGAIVIMIVVLLGQIFDLVDQSSRTMSETVFVALVHRLLIERSVVEHSLDLARPEHRACS